MRHLLTLSLLLAAGSARAFDLPPEARRALARGEAWFEVRADPAGAAGRLRAVEEVSAPPDQVFAVMTDCALAPHMVANLKSCRILERDPAGRWDVREHVSRPMLFFPSVRSIFRSEYDPPRGFSYRQTGGDLKVLEGDWRLTPLDGGTRTRVVYEGRAALPFAIPRAMARAVLRQQVAQALAALRRECVEGRPPIPG
jgi:ribosome-associated toxin RatA of RatAB toxin-antitoxin module